MFQEKKAYYQTKETVDSVPSARAALSALEAAKIEIADFVRFVPLFVTLIVFCKHKFSPLL